MRILAIAVALVGCIRSSTTICGDHVCRTGQVCAPDGVTCATPEQLDACANASEGAGCATHEIASGVCHTQICIEQGCGNGVLEPGEVCDDGNRTSLDGCRSDCRSLERCGDGVAEPALGEACDCGETTPAPIGCTGPNSSASGATCRLDCTLARCGDGIVDDDELCDDSNTIYGDGCRGDCRGRFEKLQVPTANGLLAVWMASATELYAGGFGGTILHLANGAWSLLGVGQLTSPVYAVWSTGSTLYAGGDKLVRFNGTTWKTLSTTSVTAIWGSSRDDVYVGTRQDNQLLHYTSASTTGTLVATCAGAGSNTLAIWGTGATDIYVGLTAGICHWNGSSWSLVDSLDVLSIVGTGPDDIYALAASDSSQIRHWNGTAWSDLPPIPGSAHSLAIGGGIVFAAGDVGTALSFDGTSWTNILTPTENTLYGIAATSATNVYVVGNGGTVLH